MKRTTILISTLFALMASPIMLLAQTAATTAVATAPPDTHTDVFIYTLMALMVVTILGAMLSLAYITLKIAETLRIDLMKAKGTYVEPTYSESNVAIRFWKQFGKTLNDRVPMELEASIDMGHNYDGIRELDNNLPPWWVAMFVISILFSVGYLYYYHAGGDGASAKQEYEQEMEQARLAKIERLAKQADNVNEDNAVVLKDAEGLNGGKETFNTLCKTCHGDNGQGGAGPNLTDAYWLHGGGIHNVFKTIKYGYPEKGMISWQAQLSPRKIQEVASYVLSLQGTNPAGGLPPQGTIYVEGQTTPVATDTTKK